MDTDVRPNPRDLAVVDNTEQLAAWAQEHLGLRPDRFLGDGTKLVIEGRAAVIFRLDVLLTKDDMASLKEILP